MTEFKWALLKHKASKDWKHSAPGVHRSRSSGFVQLLVKTPRAYTMMMMVVTMMLGMARMVRT